MRTLLIVLGWISLNLVSYILPMWLGYNIARDESEELLRSGALARGEHDTPAGLYVMGFAVMWTGVLLVVNVAVGIVWWIRRRRRRARSRQGAVRDHSYSPHVH